MHEIHNMVTTNGLQRLALSVCRTFLQIFVFLNTAAVTGTLSNGKPVSARNFWVPLYPAFQFTLSDRKTIDVPTPSLSAVSKNLCWYMTESLSSLLTIFLWSCYCLSFIAETVDCSHKAYLLVSPTKNNHTDSNLEVCEVTVHELFTVFKKHRFYDFVCTHCTPYWF